MRPPPLVSGLCRYHHNATVTNAAFGNDMIGEMLNLRGRTLQCSHLHAYIVVEVDVQCR